MSSRPFTEIARSNVRPGRHARRWLRWSIGLGLFLVVSLAADQLLNRFLIGDGFYRGRRIAPFDPPLMSSVHWMLLDRYRELAASLAEGREPAQPSDLDPELGWGPFPGMGRADSIYDWSGSRVAGEPLAREKRPGVGRVVAIGCSFTHGDEVAAKDSWAGIVDARREDVEIANHGVGGYGLDQCLLRLRRDGFPLDPDEVWFGWMPEATLRVTTHYSPALTHLARSVAFKPLFRLGANDELELIPNPAPSAARIVELLSSQEAFLSAVGATDFWVRRTPKAYAPMGSSWLHRSFVGRMALSWLDDRDREPWDWLLRPESEVYRQFRCLVLQTRAECSTAGAGFRVWILPSGKGLQQTMRKFGRLYWTGMVEDLRSSGVEIHDLSPVIELAGGLRNPELWMPGGHYSELTNRLIAEETLAVLAGKPRQSL